MSDFIHLNGQLLPYDSAFIAPGDAGLLHGAGLFETMRAVKSADGKSKVFRLSQHLERLTRSAGTLSIPFSLNEAQLVEMVADLLDANGLAGADARLRLTITRGDLHSVTMENPMPPVTLIISASAFQAYPPDHYQNGITVVVSPYKQNPENPTTGHKTTSYLDRLLALREAQQLKASEALWFTSGSNYLAEGSISNVFLVDKEGFLCTPPLTMPDKANQRLCLPGITRQVALELATAANILPHERLLTINDVLEAKEVFVTNAIMGIMPVTHIEKHQVGDGKPGSMTRSLMEKYAAELQK